jgi:putative FmdB family regulatory protein
VPTYEYRCPSCGKFEIVQRITEDPLKACPTCGNNVSRLISSNVGIVFKGSGWYCVDNRKSSSKESAEGAACSADNCSGSSSDSCPCSTEEKVS